MVELRASLSIGSWFPSVSCLQSDVDAADVWETHRRTRADELKGAAPESKAEAFPPELMRR